MAEKSGKNVAQTEPKMTAKQLRAYNSENAKAYKASKKLSGNLAVAAKKASGVELVELEIRQLGETKELIDRLCDNVSVASKAEDKNALKTAKARLAEETKIHNNLCDALERDAGVKLTKVSETLADSIIAGKGYRKTAKIEYQTLDYDYVQPITLAFGSSAKASLSEKSGKNIENKESGMSARQLRSYLSVNDKAYSLAKKNVNSVAKSRKSASGADLVELEIKQLCETKELVDRLCDNVAVASKSDNKSALKKAKTRLAEEIKAHNLLCDTLLRDAGLKLTKVSEGLADKIIAGEGYRRTAKIEYQTLDYDTVQTVALSGDAVGKSKAKSTVREKSGKAVEQGNGTMSKKLLNSYVAAADKSYKSKKKTIASIASARKSASGGELVELEVRQLSEIKELIDILYDNLAVASGAENKSCINTAKKRLGEEIKAHNELCDIISRDGGVTLAKISGDVVADIEAGRGYRKTTKLEYRTVDYDFVQPITVSEGDTKAKAKKLSERDGAKVEAGGLSGRLLSSYISKNNKSYIKSKKDISALDKTRRTLKGRELVELEISALNKQKELVDLLCDNLAVASASDNKGYLKTAKKRLGEEIKTHNALCDAISRDGSVTLTKVDEGVISDIISGNGYRRTAKLEYRAEQLDFVQQLKISGDNSGATVSEVSGKSVSGKGGSDKLLRRFMSEQNKSYNKSKKNISSMASDKRKAEGAALVEMEIKELAAQRQMIDGLLESVSVASSSSDKSYLKSQKKRLASEIKAHNRMVDDIARDGSVNLTKIDESIVSDVISGKGYSKMPKLEYKTREREYTQQISVIKKLTSLVKKPKKASETVIKSGSEMTKKELKAYISKSEKEIKAVRKSLAAIEKSKAHLEGAQLIEASVKAVNTERELIDKICQNLVIARGASDKSYIKSQKRALRIETSVHNGMVDTFLKESGVQIAKLSENTVNDIMSGKGYTKTPKLEYRAGGTENVHKVNLSVAVDGGVTKSDKKSRKAEEAAASAVIRTPEIRILRINDTASQITNPDMSAKELKKYKKSANKSFKRAGSETSKLEKSRRRAQSGERIDLDIKELQLKKTLIDSIADNVAVAHKNGDKAFLKASRKRLYAEIKAHNALVDDIAEVGNVVLSKVSDTLYNDIVSGNGYRTTPKINLEVAEYAPKQKIVLTEPKSKARKAEKAASEPVEEKFAPTARPLYDFKAKRAMDAYSKKSLKKYLKTKSREADAVRAELSELMTKKKIAVGIEKHKLLICCINLEKLLVEGAADSLVAARQAFASDRHTSKLKKSLVSELGEYNKLIDEYKEFTGDSLTYADKRMADKIMSGKPYTMLNEIEMIVTSSAYEYKYADYEAYARRRDGEKEAARAKSHNEVEKQNAIAFEIASLKNVVKRQADKDNRAVVSKFMYYKGLLQCEDDSRYYSYGLTKRVDRKLSDHIVKKCKQVDRDGKIALEKANAANKRYYEVVTTDPNSVTPVGYKRRWKLIPFIKRKYTNQDIVYLRDQIMRLLNERDRINGKLISIYEGQMIDMGGRPLTLEIRQVKSKAAKKKYNDRRIKAYARKVRKNIPAGSIEQKDLYCYLNDQIQAESNIAVINHRLKHAKDDKLTYYEINQLKADRARQKGALKLAESQFKRTYDRSLSRNDAGGTWLLGLGVMLAVVVGVVAAFAWFFGPNFPDNLNNLFGI